jgi:hypothetical protein
MHRAAMPARESGDLAEQFRHHGAWWRALGQAVAVLAIGRDHVVLAVERGDRADRDRLLACVQMAKAGDLAARVHLSGFFFEAADQHHPPIKI